jgi:hypothetical protein
MAREIAVEDISSNKALQKLAREVRETGQTKVLRDNGEDLAKVVPLKPRKRRPRDKAADIEAFLSSAGAWKDHIDLEQFLKDNRASRDMSSRPPVEL